MAVEAAHFNLFPAQLLPARQSLNFANQGNLNSAINNQIGFVSAPYLPEYESLYRPALCNLVQVKISANTDSGITCNVTDPRKRERDVVPTLPTQAKHDNVSRQLPYSFDADETVLPQFQMEIDDIVSRNNKKMRSELEEMRKQEARIVAASVREGVMLKMRQKDEQIQRMVSANSVLQERVKSLFVENQLWRDLAQTSEDAANSIRADLEHVLLHLSGGGNEGNSGRGSASSEEEDVQSCCGSSDDDGRGAGDGGRERMCRKCGEREACVLLLPCRHLCLCGTCGSGSRRPEECPVCNCSMGATLHVNMTSS